MSASFRGRVLPAALGSVEGPPEVCQVPVRGQTSFCWGEKGCTCSGAVLLHSIHSSTTVGF